MPIIAVSGFMFADSPGAYSDFPKLAQAAGATLRSGEIARAIEPRGDRVRVVTNGAVIETGAAIVTVLTATVTWVGSTTLALFPRATRRSALGAYRCSVWALATGGLAPSPTACAMNEAISWRVTASSGQKATPGSQPVVIPTYHPMAPDKNPMFLERRVYQGSSGAVYPLPFYDRVATEPVPSTRRR